MLLFAGEPAEVEVVLWDESSVSSGHEAACLGETILDAWDLLKGAWGGSEARRYDVFQDLGGEKRIVSSPRELHVNFLISSSCMKSK